MAVCFVNIRNIMVCTMYTVKISHTNYDGLLIAAVLNSFFESLRNSCDSLRKQIFSDILLKLSIS